MTFESGHSIQSNCVVAGQSHERAYHEKRTEHANVMGEGILLYLHMSGSDTSASGASGVETTRDAVTRALYSVY